MAGCASVVDFSGEFSFKEVRRGVGVSGVDSFMLKDDNSSKLTFDGVFLISDLLSPSSSSNRASAFCCDIASIKLC